MLITAHIYIPLFQTAAFMGSLYFHNKPARNGSLKDSDQLAFMAKKRFEPYLSPTPSSPHHTGSLQSNNLLPSSSLSPRIIKTNMLKKKDGP